MILKVASASSQARRALEHQALQFEEGFPSPWPLGPLLWGLGESAGEDSLGFPSIPAPAGYNLISS
jgi:hypothetical protein